MHTHLSTEEVAEIRAAYNAGATYDEIQFKTGRAPDSIMRALQKTGGPRSAHETRKLRLAMGLTSAKARYRGKRAIDVDCFKTLDDDKAWLLGLAFGDGNVREAGRFLLSCGPDKDLAEKTAAILKAEPTVYHVRGCWHMEVYSKAIVRSLALYGIIPAKTYSMKFPSLATNLLPHFVRGLWESDGSMYESATGLQLQYTTASCCFGNVLSVVLPLISGVTARLDCMPKEPPRAAQYRVSLSGTSAKSLVRCMYGASSPHNRCDRKWAIAEKHL